MLKSNRRDRAMFIMAFVFFQFIVDLTIIFDIPVARQVLSFIYLIFVPGIILLKTLGTENLDSVERFLFSVGLSVAIIIFLGLIVNQIGISFENSGTLSIPTLLLATNSAVSFLCALCFVLNKNGQWDKAKLNFSLSWVLIICLPIISITGATLVKFSGNSIVLLLMIGAIALTVLMICVRSARTNWSLILYMITIAMLFHSTFISNYIVGYDVHPQYHVFEITQSKGVWNSIINETDPVTPRTNQMLSVTIFPAIYSNMLDLEGTWIFNIVYPLIFALVPVGLYQLYQLCAKSLQKKVAFLASFVVLADITFCYEMPGLQTQMIGEFFLVLSLIVIFHKKIRPSKRVIFLTLFSAGMIVSHYGISYIFMFLILLAWSILFFGKKQPKIEPLYIILFFVMTFCWYIYTSQSASFTSLVDMGQNIYQSFWTDLLNPQSRAEQALRAVGLGESATSIGHWLGRVLHYAIQFFMVLGVVAGVLKWKMGHKFTREYLATSILMLTFAMLPLIAPSFNLLNVTRMYHISLLFLAPCCVVGGELFFSFFRRLRKSTLPFVLISLLIVLLFLFETGFIYEVTHDVSYSVPLSMYRTDRAVVYGNGYLMEHVDISGAEWLRSNIAATENTIVYADIISAYLALTSYAVFPRDHTEILSNVTSFDGPNAYVYLRNFNTVDGKIVGEGGYTWNTSDISPRFEVLDKVYTNGGSEIFFALNETSQ